MTDKKTNKKPTIRIPSDIKKEVSVIAKKESRSCESQAAVLLQKGIEQYKAEAAA
ncbi:MAG: hypothetical protein OQK32_07860 [Gammaproteobacteria bacterium]|nr:hypothetical protein [Gammaproteobacteria bacterium]MCW8923704.1 hypothetical protein [Gammaproteobacteria bacterium]